MFDSLSIVDMLKRQALSLYAGAHMLEHKPSVDQIDAAVSVAAAQEKTLMAIESSSELSLGQESLVVVRELRKIAKRMASSKNTSFDAYSACCDVYTAMQMLDNISRDIIIQSTKDGENS